MKDKRKSSYEQALKSSSIMGAAAGISLLIGMVRVKFVAVLIGTIGVGLLANYKIILGLLTTISGLGIQSSAVRDIACVVEKNDEQSMGRAVLTLRRICWITGLFGMMLMMGSSPLLSQWMFGSNEYTLDIATLGFVILFSNISGGQVALIQGMRRIGDLAKIDIISASIGTVIAASFYVWIGVRGIVPALLAMAFVQLAVSWCFARRIAVLKVTMTWLQSVRESGGIMRLGLAFMWSALIESLVAYITNALITQQISLEAVGVYSAAFALSSIFIDFVLKAMIADYYPRLTGLVPDSRAMNLLVNEQTEIGLLLVAPGLLATMSFAPWIIHVFYTSEFLKSADLMQWLILGCLGKVISWPIGFLILALGKGKLFVVTETLDRILFLILISITLPTLGLEGVAMSFFATFTIYTAVVYYVSRHLTEFSWSSVCRRLFLKFISIFMVLFVAVRVLPLWPATIFGAIATIGSSLLCLRGLISRVGVDNRWVHAVLRIPGMRSICGASV